MATVHVDIVCPYNKGHVAVSTLTKHLTVKLIRLKMLEVFSVKATLKKSLLPDRYHRNIIPVFVTALSCYKIIIVFF